MTVDDGLDSTLLAQAETLLGLLIAIEPVGEEFMSGLSDASPALLTPGFDLWQENRWNV